MYGLGTKEFRWIKYFETLFLAVDVDSNTSQDGRPLSLHTEEGEKIL